MTDTPIINHVSQMDRGLAYAESCFETFRVIHGDIFQWTAHWQRLCRGLQAFGISIEHQQTSIAQHCLAAAKQHGHDALIRLTVSGGEASWGISQDATPIFHIQALPFQQAQPLNLVEVSYPFPLHHKFAKFTADYSERLRSIQQAQAKHPNLAPAHYLFCQQQMVLSGFTANILIFHDNHWKTPQGAGVLIGIVAQFLIRANLVQAQTCPTSLLQECQAMLAINCGQFVQAVASINGKNLNMHHPAITSIQHALSQEKGVFLD